MTRHCRRSSRTASAVVALVVLGAAPEARAWEVFFQATSETTFRASSETSSATTRADRAERARGSRSAEGSMCSEDWECNGWCDHGTCLDPPQAQRAPPPVAPPTGPNPAYACVNDQSCASGYACREAQCVAVAQEPEYSCIDDRACTPGYTCRDRQCVPVQSAACVDDRACAFGYACQAGQCVDVSPERPVTCVDDTGCGDELRCRNSVCVKVDPPRPAPTTTCTSVDQCARGQGCVRGQCLSPPPPPPSSSLWRRGSELYLRDRAVQLRQDLALGEGPVISTLAVVHGVPAPTLGRTMRAHRAELVAMMGDGTDARWTRRFLIRLEALCPEPVRLSVR